MGSPLSQVLADIFMEEFENSSLNTADLQPKLWLRYVDDTFVVWPHGRDTLQDFLQHLNQQHPSITMETEEDHKIAFLDVGISRNPDGSLHHNVYRKPTHTDRYLNQRSFHHPSIKSSVNRTLVQRAYNICDKDSLPKELQHIRTTLKRNGYNPNKISTAKPVPNPESKVSDLTLSACLPYLGSTSHKLRLTSSVKQASMCSIQPPANSKDFYTPTRTNRTQTRERESTGSPVSAVRCTSVKLNATSPPD